MRKSAIRSKIKLLGAKTNFSTPICTKRAGFALLCPIGSCGKNGDPGVIRTRGLRFRKPSLYPAELRGRKGSKIVAIARQVPTPIVFQFLANFNFRRPRPSAFNTVTGPWAGHANTSLVCDQTRDCARHCATFLRHRQGNAGKSPREVGQGQILEVTLSLQLQPKATDP